jgi:hypothetical protein
LDSYSFFISITTNYILYSILVICMTTMKQCPFLNDWVVKGEAINAECEAPMREACPKVRSTKKAVTRQCWRMLVLTEAETKAKADATAQRLAQKKPKKVPVAKKQKEPKQEKPAPVEKVERVEKVEQVPETVAEIPVTEPEAVAAE